MKYYVEYQETTTTTWEIEANSEDDAFSKYEQGEATLIDEYVDDAVDVWPEDYL